MQIQMALRKHMFSTLALEDTGKTQDYELGVVRGRGKRVSLPSAIQSQRRLWDELYKTYVICKYNYFLRSVITRYLPTFYCSSTASHPFQFSRCFAIFVCIIYHTRILPIGWNFLLWGVVPILRGLSEPRDIKLKLVHGPRNQIKGS